MLDDYQKIKEVVRSSRDIVLPFYGIADVTRQKDDSAHNIVTELDCKVEQYLAKEFKKEQPNITFVGEEFGGDRTQESFWLVDPIDGTMHFVRGVPFCTTMVAHIHQGIVVFSAIYDFVNDTLYWAQKGGGAFKENQPLRISERPVTQSLISVETNTSKPENTELLKQLRKKSLLLNTITAGYEFVLVASGKIEARICRDPFGKDYDYAPGSLLVSEAGGIVGNIGFSSYDFKNTDFIAASPIFYEHLTRGPDALFPIT